MSKFSDIIKSDIEYHVLLPEYYRRDVRSIFTDLAGEKGYKHFTVFMIPNLTGWFDERLACIKTKMEEAGYKDISFENRTDYIKMTDDEIENHIKFGDIKFHVDEWFADNFDKKFPLDLNFSDGSPLGILAAMLLKK